MRIFTDKVTSEDLKSVTQDNVVTALDIVERELGGAVAVWIAAHIYIPRYLDSSVLSNWWMARIGGELKDEDRERLGSRST